MAARAKGTVASTSRFHLRVKWGGQIMRILLKPAICAAAAMKVFPVPISPTTVVPRWASRERAAPLMASACRPQGSAEQPGERPAVLRGPVERRVGLNHPLRDSLLVGVYEVSEVHVVSSSFSWLLEDDAGTRTHVSFSRRRQAESEGDGLRRPSGGVRVPATPPGDCSNVRASAGGGTRGAGRAHAAPISGCVNMAE